MPCLCPLLTVVSLKTGRQALSHTSCPCAAFSFKLWICAVVFLPKPSAAPTVWGFIAALSCLKARNLEGCPEALGPWTARATGVTLLGVIGPGRLVPGHCQHL